MWKWTLSLKGDDMYFEKPGRDNTGKTIELAHTRAKELGIDEVVVASSRGYTAHKTLEVFKDFNVVIVTYPVSYTHLRAHET